ncbi:ABC transporter ATP-binding protein [Dokdonella koreensis]|uniref:ABC transporter ATP-binding protein n=1 Tax=Dokdonella koreensis DS-123 TaxID=1300342 RepID=A0A160DY70_9GAMM|nr:ATP-binding cassette domain-containing protein [Dokdonella koreensis]ANB19718.1 ABC transporter ATP-binding protein [Dokdonella koreensis DS-123]
MDPAAPPLADRRPPPLIELERARVMRGSEVVLHDVSLRIDQGQHVAILGPNGCGKSTFVKLINRELYALARGGPPPVTVLGQSRWDVFSLRAQLGLVAPDLHRDFSTVTDLSAEDAVVCGFFASLRTPLHAPVTEALRARARAALEESAAGHLAARPVASLSTGELRRVLIARALAHHPQALLLDEPTTGLDIVARRQFVETLRTLARHGITLVLVTHHLDEIVPEIGRVVLLREGRVFADGPPEEVLTSAKLSALYGQPLRVDRDGAYFRLGWA